MLALLCTVAQGVWAQTPVSSEQELNAAITDGATNIQLTADILLGNYLNIEGVTVTIDLNGHKLYRNLSSSSDDGNVIWVHNNGNLTIEDNSSTHSGSIEGGNATNGGGINVWPGCSLTVSYVTFKDNSASDNGGAIFVRNGANVTISNATFIGNFAADHAGAIWNNGTLSATDCTFTNNRAKDVGGIYNSVTETDGTTYAGTATLTDCTFERNAGTTGAGALANALGDTEMTIEDCIIENNSAYEFGAGIWNGGTLNVKGAVKVTGNKNDDGMFSNLYLKSKKFITLTGDISGSNIGVEMESVSGPFTSGYNTHHSGVDPSNFFSADRLSAVSLGLDDNGEASLLGQLTISYIERSWDATNKEVVSTQKRLIGLMIDHNATPIEGQFKDVTNAPDDNPDEWFGMGGFSDDVPEFYVVRENVNRKTIVVQGKNVHLILCDGATLTLTGGLRLEEDYKLYIHCQSYGGDMGRLMVTNSYEDAAGIGSALYEIGWNDYAPTKAGELVIYGGHIEATGGESGAGIGTCSAGNVVLQLYSKVTVYGGFVKAQGGEHAAGIGGGAYINGGDFILYDGTVIANGGGGLLRFPPGKFAPGTYSPLGGGAGVGGGGTGTTYKSGTGGNVTIYGGTLTATGGGGAAGIGSAHFDADYINQICGGTFTIYGGTVTATGGVSGAGIGGGYQGGGAEVSIYGGTVTANGGVSGAGIGGGDDSFGGTVIISGGTVTATGGDGAAGIGGGDRGDGGEVTITGGTVIAKAGKQGGTDNIAIGPGYRDLSSLSEYGTLTIGNAMMVGAGNDGAVERIYDADERKNACWFRSYAEVSPCTHPSGVTYTIEGTDANGTHTSHCKHCGVSETAAHFNSDGTGTCICGYKDGEGYCTITVATSIDGAIYEGVGVMAKVGNNMPYTLPVCSSIPEGYDFAGWAVAPTSHNGIRPNEGEELKQAGENITVTGNISIFARYKDLAISLADGSDNAETLYNYNGRKAASVTLTGRKLYKDGGWNTLCLPFSLTEDQVTAQLAPGELKTLASSEFGNGTLTLTFANATTIEAGKPYIVKWAATTPDYVENPAFSDVTINDSYTPVETDYVDFVGTFSPIDIFTEFKTNLYLGADNLLYYPSGEDMTSFPINSFRAFFQLKEGLTAGEPVSTEVQEIRSFVLNFGEETGIEEVNGYGLRVNGYGSEWCTLDGRRLDGEPEAKGLYIHNGVKVLIK